MIAFVYITSLFFFSLDGFIQSCLNYGNLLNSLFCLDVVSVGLITLTLLIGFCVVSFGVWFCKLDLCCVFFSLVFACLGYISCHVVVFWSCYELSILFLLFPLLWSSPYPERYSALSYLVFYFLGSGLPMLVVFILLGGWFGDFNCLQWDFGENCFELLSFLGILFFSKVPLFPFQAWLPVVHAESSSLISVCLSGYIMKLGLLGLFRFCYKILCTSDSFVFYVVWLVVLSNFFFLLALCELDVKRWLAILSVCHIVLVPLCLVVCSFEDMSVGILYSVGHGVAAGLTFMVFWLVSCFSGSRCWYFFKNGLGDSFLVSVFLVSCLCLSGSVPPTLQFFSEVVVVSGVNVVSLIMCLVFCVYLLVSPLISICCLGCLLTRYRSVSVFIGGFSAPLLSIFFIGIWGVFSFILI